MITEIVTFELPKGISRGEVMEKYRTTASAWSKNTDLIRKNYFFDEAKSLGGGVYVWTSLEAADKWHGDDYKNRIRELYGSEVTMTRFDTLLVVDNVSREVSELAAE